VEEFERDNVAQEALKWFLQPIRTLRTVLGARTRGGERILEEKLDQTVIGEGGSIDTVVGQVAHFGDCGHYLQGNLGGRCSCGAIVCKACLRRCAACGLPLCPPCCAYDPQTGVVLCYGCSDETRYQRRAREVGRTLASLFLEEDGGGQKT